MKLKNILKPSLFFFVLINLLFFFFDLNKISASQQQIKNSRVVCLKAEKLEDDPHAGRISVDPANKLIPESQTYVFECIGNSYDCTTGNSQLDTTLFGKDNLRELNRKYGYEFKGSNIASNPIMSDKNGFIPQFIWKSYTPDERSRMWLALNYFSSDTEEGRGGQGSQQLLTFKLREAFNTEKCVSLSWDPYGIVFDSVTLEPVSNARVTLLRKRANGSFSPVKPEDIFGGLIINPQTTKEDGFFNFIVPDGTYKLIVESNEYIFPEKKENINRNYLRIYSDIYPDETGEEIIQAGAIQHRDIPVKPKSISQNNKPVLMEIFYFSEKSNPNLIARGKVSHPFSKIHFYSLIVDENDKNDPQRGNLIKTINADKLGRFSYKINQSNFKKNEFFGEISVEKVDLTKNDSFSFFEKIKKFLKIKKVDANITIASSYRFNPILNYIEGYAYDSQGKVIPNAKVNLVTEFSQKPFYTTNADEKGYFKITSEFIPFFPYRIQYENPFGERISLSTANFISQNKDFIEKEKIDLNRFKVAADKKNNLNNNFEQDPKSTSSVFQKNDNLFERRDIDKKEKLPDNFKQDLQPDQNIKKAVNNNFIIIVFLILSLLILFFLILFFYIRKKNNFSS